MRGMEFLKLPPLPKVTEQLPKEVKHSFLLDKKSPRALSEGWFFVGKNQRSGTGTARTGKGSSHRKRKRL